MKYFTNISNITKPLMSHGAVFINTIKQSTNTRLVLLFAILLSTLSIQQANAQCATPSVMAKWDFNSTTSQCNGAVENKTSGNSPGFSNNTYFYCPNTNAGCAKALLGSKGFQNTPNYKNAVCLANFYAFGAYSQIGASDWDPNSSDWHPESSINFNIQYEIPAGKSGSLTSFALQILQPFFGLSPKPDFNTVNFEKQGVAVYRNGILIYSTTQPIVAANINATPLLFNFPTTSEFTSDGSATVSFTIVFGLIHKMVARDGGPGSPLQTGYDNFCINGTCGSGPSASANISPATCGASGANADGKITLSNFGATDHFDYTTGTTYSGAATYASATAVPAGGVISSTLANPITPQTYTVRVFSAAGCTTDLQVTLNPVVCPKPPGGGCTPPTGTITTPTGATCAVGTDASIAVSGVVGGDKVGISAGTAYTGPLYGSAIALSGGAYTFTGLVNPSGSQAYTIRVYNGADDCFADYPVIVAETVCPCKKVGGEIIYSDQADPDSSPNNGVGSEDDFATYEVCKGTQNIDLKLTKTVTPNTGTTCPTNTDFVWTITLTNAGTMTATNIQVADILPTGLVLTASTPSTGTFTPNAGWIIPSLAASGSATLSLTTKALVAGTFNNCAEIMTAFPLNDPNSTPGNGITTEDDYACASITVTGAKTPEISKEFSPMATKPNVPLRLTIKIVNNEAIPITTTAALVDNLPSSPAQMTVATTPNLVTGLTGVIATAGGTSITIPSGTVLLPGLNQIQLDVIAPSDGEYCNTIAAGALKTTSCDNLLATSVCVTVNSDFVIAPLISKTMLPAIIQTGTNSTLTITVENRNTSAITLTQNFIDDLPTGLTLAGAVSGTCVGTSTFGSTNQVGLSSGAIIAPGTCTIIVPVTSATAGTYCNYIPANSLLGTVNNGVTDVITGNQDHAEACVTVNPNPCTALSAAAISPATATVAPNAAYSLTANATGESASTLYQWSAPNGTFSTQAKTTSWTAPATPGVYTITVNLDNQLTGYGTCTATATAQITVSAAACGVSLTATPGTCTVATNQYDVTGNLTFANAPTTGTLTVSMGAATQVFNAPFTTGQAYTLSGLTADGASHTVTATFSADANCTNTMAYTAPASCAVVPVCSISLTATAGTCTVATNQYAVTGTLTFSNAPSTGTLTVAMGSVTQVFNAPFTTGQAYTLSGLTADGASHNVTATFSADANCTNTMAYTAPASCSLVPVCSISLTATAGTCTVATNKYDVTGSLTFSNAPSTGTLTVSMGAATQVFNAPFTTGQAYTLSGLTADGASHNVTATFSADANCTNTMAYTAPASCSLVPVCSISLTATPSACTVATNQYAVTGTLTFANAPTTGTLTVAMGSVTQVFNAPFTTGQAYTLSGLTADGASHNVTATFSADANCTNTMAYTAPASCTVVCTKPTFILTTTPATCAGTTANGDAKISLATITNGDKAAYSIGSSYTGGAYSTATSITSGAITFSNISNVSGNNVYTIRVFNGTDACYQDKTIIIPVSDCNTLCNVDGGNDLMLCTPTAIADLKDALATEEWIVGSGNPAAASINASTGVISGISVDGIYSFILRDKVNTTCSDIVYIFRSVTDLPTLSSCESTYQLPTDGGVTWTVAVGNTASVTASGLVTGMTTDGTYTYNATFGACTATVDVVKITCACIVPSAGLDFTICLPKTGADLLDAPSGYTWATGVGNPVAASINATTGVITGMSVVGTYKFILQKTGETTCFDEIQIIVTAGDVPIVLCSDGSTFYTIIAQAGLTNVVWYNMADVQVGTGNSLIVKATTLGLEDGVEAYYYKGQSSTSTGCDAELCCPVKFLTQNCCPTPNCAGVTIIKNIK
jgi:uncharacterized repeat protein (TIGR01451 family)